MTRAPIHHPLLSIPRAFNLTHVCVNAELRVLGLEPGAELPFSVLQFLSLDVYSCLQLTNLIVSFRVQFL